MVRRMSNGMQEYNLNKMLANTGWGNFDVSAHMDRSLHFDENVRNIQGILGIRTRDSGMEFLQRQNEERAREHHRRMDAHRQTGHIQNAHNRYLDSLIQALPPGRRVSANGNVYYERRENRSDRDPQRRL